MSVLLFLEQLIKFLRPTVSLVQILSSADALLSAVKTRGNTFLYVLFNFYFKKRETPKVAPACLAFLLRIREVPGSNLGTETGYPEDFVVYLSSSRQTSR
jgi:hypothetical protein